MSGLSLESLLATSIANGSQTGSSSDNDTQLLEALFKKLLEVLEGQDDSGDDAGAGDGGGASVPSSGGISAVPSAPASAAAPTVAAVDNTASSATAPATDAASGPSTSGSTPSTASSTPSDSPSDTSSTSDASKSASSSGSAAVSDSSEPTDAGGPPGNPGNVAGKGDVDPSKPIYVPMDSDGQYNKDALDALAKQGLNGIAPVGNVSPGQGADATPGGDPGAKSDSNDKWEISNGPAAGIPYGGALTWAAYQHGYTSTEDLQRVLVQPQMESSYDANYTQQGDQGGTGGGAQGLLQLDPHYHSTENAYNPFHNADMVVGLARSMGQSAGTDGSYKQDELVYNTGQANTDNQQNKLGTYGQTSDQLVAALQAGNINFVLNPMG